MQSYSFPARSRVSERPGRLRAFANGKLERAIEYFEWAAALRPEDFQAILLVAQVYHSLGEAAQAIAEYRRVEDRFADAKEAIQYFLRKAIELDPAFAEAYASRGLALLIQGKPADAERDFERSWSHEYCRRRITKRDRAGIRHIAHWQERRLGEPASKACICLR